MANVVALSTDEFGVTMAACTATIGSEMERL
jgi:hypothetical protein